MCKLRHGYCAGAWVPGILTIEADSHLRMPEYLRLVDVVLQSRIAISPVERVNAVPTVVSRGLTEPAT